MTRQISIKTRFGWISAFEKKGKIVKVKFGKSKNIHLNKSLYKYLHDAPLEFVLLIDVETLHTLQSFLSHTT